MPLRLTALLILTAMPALADSYDDGASLYAASCARCHGNDGSGGRKGGNILGTTPEAIKAAHATLKGFSGSDSDLQAIAAFLAPLTLE